MGGAGEGEEVNEHSGGGGEGEEVNQYSGATLIYEELCNHKRTACHFAWIDSALAHIVRKLVPV